MNKEQKAKYFSEFNSIGEPEVRRMVGMNAWKSSDPNKHNAAKNGLFMNPPSVKNALKREMKKVYLFRVKPCATLS